MSTPFDPEQGLIVVSARLHGPMGMATVQLALDTGATNSMVSCDVAFALGYDLAAATSKIRVTTGSGVELAPQIVFARAEALGRARDDFQMLCHTLPPSAGVDGLLGLGYLRGCRLVIDFRSGNLQVV